MNQSTKQILKGLGIGLGLLAFGILILRKRKKPKSILIVGDSQSAILDNSGKKITFTYPNILKQTLEPQGYKVDVLALGGKQTQWMKDNLPNQLAKNKYDRVYIYGGGNDVSSGTNLDKTLGNFQSMVDMVKNNGADAFIILGYRIDNFADYKKMPITPYIKRKEDWLPIIEKRKLLQKSLPTSIKGASFVPVYDLGTRTADGIHPNAEGHKIVAENILKSII